ncbi:MAG: PA14 domain-containing protein [Puia sp.]|nr:PA14 domain-containing protein [Puia sp.]
MKIDTMEIILKRSAPANLIWKLSVYPDETHSSLRLKSIYDGLKFTYAGLTSHIEFHPMNGIVLKDKPIKIWYFDDTTRMSYTLDGTIPDPSSPKVQHEITLNGPATVTYKRFTNRSSHDKTVTGHFTAEKIAPPVPQPKNTKPGGFHYAYYEGDWDRWPDLTGIKPVKTGITDKNFDPDKLPRENNYALVIDGWLESKEEGYYIFFLQADKDSKLYLDNKLLMQWEGNYDQGTYSCILPLSKGFYPFRIEYLHKNKDFRLGWVWLTPGIMNTKNPIPIPVEAQYSQP